MNLYLFIFIYLFYALASIFLFTITSHGWSTILWIIPLLIYYFALPLLFFLILLLSAFLNKEKLTIILKINLKLLIGILSLQTLGLLLNTGDWGDSYSTSFSYVFLLDNFPDNKIWLENVRNELFMIGIVAKLLYFVLLYTFLFWTLSTGKTIYKTRRVRSRNK